MTVGELRRKISSFGDNAEIILVSACFGEKAFTKDFHIQANDYNVGNSVAIEFSIKDMLIPYKTNAPKR